SRQLNAHLVGASCFRNQIPLPFQAHIDAWIVVALRQVPPVNLGCARLQLKLPLPRCYVARISFPTLAFPSTANSPRTPGSFPVARRNKSAIDARPQCRWTRAGCSRAEVPATSPRTCKIPVDCSVTPLRQGCASSRNCQRPGETCSTLPETLVNANGLFSSPSLKFTRPSSNSIFSR